jgi:hypothetical protein
LFVGVKYQDVMQQVYIEMLFVGVK